MKRALNLGLLSVLLVMSCTKSETKTDPCAKGTLKFISYSKYPYTIYLNDREVKTLDQKNTYEHEAYTGHYNIKIEQDSGYIATPYMKEYSVNLGGCKTETFVIPKQPMEPDK